MVKIVKTKVELPETADRINNVEQKEVALHTSGVTRRKAYEAVYRGLTAKKKVEKINDVGVKEITEEDDIEKQLKAAELAARLFGDAKEGVNIMQNNVTISAEAKAIVSELVRC